MVFLKHLWIKWRTYSIVNIVILKNTVIDLKEALLKKKTELFGTNKKDH